MNEKELADAIQYNLDYLEGNISIEQQIEDIMNYKINRQLERIKEELQNQKIVS